MAYRQECGDTLVEVLMAVAILSIVIVGAITLMARGLTAVQSATEHTQVRLSISAQTELLRYLRDGYLQSPTGVAGQTWTALFTGTPAYADTIPAGYGGTCGVTTGKSPFYLTQSNGSVVVTAFNASNQPAAAAQPGAGLWIEATRSGSGVSPAYVDFQLRGCWSGIGGSAVQQTVTAVRLYDPAH